ncbi:MAG: rhomboid family intramembrane serine protease [Candidatus Eisenbacteria bacterium]|nr:rhomboid family intramembrane serine protease [Candidatus Eisenbacteria bacterium]
MSRRVGRGSSENCSPFVFPVQQALPGRLMYYFYFLPVGTEIRLRKVPLVTLALLGGNVAVFVALRLLGTDSRFLLRLAFVPARFEIHALFTSCFVHLDYLHIIPNLLYLWIFGSVLEDRMGRLHYLGAYLVCGALSMMAQAVAVANLVPQNLTFPIIGASGAISGLLGLFLVRFYYARIKVASLTLLFFQGVYRASISRLNAGGAMLLWILIQLAYGLSSSSNPVSTTAYWSHVSGFLFGLLLGITGGLGKEASLERKLLKGRRYFEEGKWFAAMGELIEFLQTRPLDAEARALLARTFLLTGQRTKAVAEYSKAVVGELSAGGFRVAAELYEEMKRVSDEAKLPSSFQLLMARHLEESNRLDLSAEAYATFGGANPGMDKAPASLLKAAGIYATKLNDLDKAGELYQRVRGLYPQTRWAQIARKKLAEIGRIAARRSAFPQNGFVSS